MAAFVLLIFINTDFIDGWCTWMARIISDVAIFFPRARTSLRLYLINVTSWKAMLLTHLILKEATGGLGFRLRSINADAFGTILTCWTILHHSFKLISPLIESHVGIKLWVGRFFVFFVWIFALLRIRSIVSDTELITHVGSLLLEILEGHWCWF